MATLYEVLQKLRGYNSSPKTQILEVEPEDLKWCQKFVPVHTVFCEDSIKAIVKSIQKIRNQSPGHYVELVTSYNKEKRCAQVHVDDKRELKRIAEIKMDGSEGFPDCIKVTNYALESDEVEFFRAVRDSRPSFKDWKFRFNVIEAT